MVQNAYNQCKLYRQYLRDNSTGANGLWKHILLGSGVQDNGHWSTGNGWAAAGMLRVLATIKNSNYAGSMKNQIGDLSGWVKEIQDGMYAHLVRVLVFSFCLGFTKWNDSAKLWSF